MPEKNKEKQKHAEDVMLFIQKISISLYLMETHSM